MHVALSAHVESITLRRVSVVSGEVDSFFASATRSEVATSFASHEQDKPVLYFLDGPRVECVALMTTHQIVAICTA